MFTLPSSVTLFIHPCGNDPASDHAASELSRLLALCGCRTERKEISSSHPVIFLGNAAESDVSQIRFDGFSLTLTDDGAAIEAPTGKGLLNGVYEFAERLGFRFLTPLPDGELVPDHPKALPAGKEICNPRFPHRGIFIQPVLYEEVPMADRLRFFAKLKYNAVCFHGEEFHDDALFRRLGLRAEAGGHGFSRLLDRGKFAEHPEYFRMFQPEDLGGKRQPDSNLCVTNPEVREIVAAEFRKLLAQKSSYYAFHCWADDLPASGWCWCPSCRSYSPSAQNMLGMKLLCRAADAGNFPQRIPVIAYHDTLFPDPQIPAEARMFLLWAPRERCYSHAINDPDCPRNAIHWKGLLAWKEKFAGIDDSHTFEYYLDQLLFNGFHPFTPDVIAKDMDAYHEVGIESHMTLQCVPCDIIPDFNQQFFARAHWHADITEHSFLEWLTDDPALRDFLHHRASVFREVLAMCGHPMDIYLDFRFLPESNDGFSRGMVEKYRNGSEALASAAKTFSGNLLTGPWKRFAEQMVRQAEFESAELKSMFYQQSAMCKIAEAQIENSEEAAKRACDLLEMNLRTIENAAEKCRAAGYPDASWHLKKRIPMELREAANKLAEYRKFKKL